MIGKSPGENALRPIVIEMHVAPGREQKRRQTSAGSAPPFG